jgi:hypothetical protein
MKKTLALFLAAIMLVATLAFMSSCSGGREIFEGAIWELSEDKESYTLINLEKGYTETSYKVPETVDGKPVTAIADDAFAYNFPDLVSITIPESVTSIGKNAFRDCAALTTVNIPSKVTVINDQTFLGCKSLETVKLPDGITKIGDNAFGQCEALKSITIPASVTTIGGWALSDCTELETISISKNVTSISDYALPYDTLEKVDFGGTKSDWYDATGKTESDTWGCDIRCSDGTIEAED